MTILVASGLALIVVITSLWHGKPGMTDVAMILTTGLLTGIIWGILRRPTPLMAALEADRQMGLAELLSSAWLARRTQNYRNNPWPAALVAMADSRCAVASTSSVALARLGGRTWGVVFLSAAMVFTLALLGPSPARDPSDRDRAASSLASGKTSNDPHSADVYGSAIDRPIVLADPDDLNASTFGQNPSLRRADSSAKAADASDSDTHAGANANSSTEGHGPGSARTEKSAAQARLPEGHGGNSTPKSDKPGELAAGAGSPSDHIPPESATATGGIASGFAPKSAAPPWAGADWSSDIHRAQTALNDGRIPAAYRDLVKGYFSGTTN